MEATREEKIGPNVLEVEECGGTYIMHGIDKELGGVIGEVIDQSGPVRVRVHGELFDPRNDFIRKQAPTGLYVGIGADG